MVAGAVDEGAPKLKAGVLEVLLKENGVVAAASVFGGAAFPKPPFAAAPKLKPVVAGLEVAFPKMLVEVGAGVALVEGPMAPNREEEVVFWATPLAGVVEVEGCAPNAPEKLNAGGFEASAGLVSVLVAGAGAEADGA